MTPDLPKFYILLMVLVTPWPFFLLPFPIISINTQTNLEYCAPKGTILLVKDSNLQVLMPSDTLKMLNNSLPINYAPNEYLFNSELHLYEGHVWLFGFKMQCVGVKYH